VRPSNKVVSLYLAPFSEKVENHWFKEIMSRLIEYDDVIRYEGALKMILLRVLEWLAPALLLISCETKPKYMEFRQTCKVLQ